MSFFLRSIAFRHLSRNVCLLARLSSAALPIRSWFLPRPVSLEGMAYKVNVSQAGISRCSVNLDGIKGIS